MAQTGGHRGFLITVLCIAAAVLLLSWLAGGLSSSTRQEDQFRAARPIALPTQSTGVALLPVPTALRISVAAAAGSAKFDERLRRLDPADGPALLAAASAGMVPGADWTEQLLALEAMRICRGRVHAADSSSLSSAQGCGALRALSSVQLDEGEQRLFERIARTDSPLHVPPLRTPEGQPLPPEDLAKARQRIRQGLQSYGVAALEWYHASIAGLAAIDGAAPGRIDLLGSEVGQPLLAAMEVARCQAGAPCAIDEADIAAPCTASERCTSQRVDAILARLPGSQREPAREMAREMAVAIERGQWSRLGL